MARRALKLLALVAVGFSAEGVITNDFADGTQMYRECTAEGKNKTRVSVDASVPTYYDGGFIKPASLSDDCNGMSFYCTRKDEQGNLICDWCVNNNGNSDGIKLFNYDPDQFWNRVDQEKNKKGAAFRNACGKDEYLHCAMQDGECKVASVQESVAKWVRLTFPEDDFKDKFRAAITAVMKAFRDKAYKYVEIQGGGKMGKKKNQIKQLFVHNKGRLAKCVDGEVKPLSSNWCSKRNLGFDVVLGVCAPRDNMFQEVKDAFAAFFSTDFSAQGRKDLLAFIHDTVL